MTDLELSDPSAQARRSGRGRSPVYAALDLGTNNCRLLVARPAPGGFRVIDSFSRIVRLGEGAAASGRLSEEAIDRTIAALRICARKMHRRNVTRSQLVATEACRQTANGAAFIERVRIETGLALEVISHDEEAALAVLGCSTLLEPEARRALVFDIGGGSTEINWLDLETGEQPRLLGWTSVPCGVVNLAERFGGDAIAADRYGAMIEDVDAHLAPFEARHAIGAAIAAGGVQMLGTSGTVTTLAGVHLGLRRYDRSRVDGIYLEFADIERSSRSLSRMSYAERAAHPTIGPGRADLVVAGCAILEAVMRNWPVGRLRVADRGLREGILRTLIESDRRAASP